MVLEYSKCTSLVRWVWVNLNSPFRPTHAVGGEQFVMQYGCECFAEAQLAEISVPDSDLGFLCKNWSLSSCSEVLLHNTYLDSSIHHTQWLGMEDQTSQPLSGSHNRVTAWKSYQAYVYGCLGLYMIRTCQHQFAVLIQTVWHQKSREIVNSLG